MQINQNSKLLKWAYLGSDYRSWSQVSLCVLFWRMVLITPLKIIGVAAMCGIVLCTILFTLYFMIHAAFTHLTITGLVLGGTTALVLLILGTRKVAGGGTLVGEFVAAKKRKICPLIKIVRD